MADSDPISDSTPNKRRKVEHPGGSKEWDSADDSGDELLEQYETAATLPLAGLGLDGSQSQSQSQKRSAASAFHSDMSTSTLRDNASQQPRTSYVTQPTQPLPAQRFPTQTQTLQHVTQPTQPLPPAHVLVGRSSPPLPALSSPKAAPAPAPVFKRSSLLATSLAPPGTLFRRPVGVQAKPAAVPVDDSDDEDPPIPRSSDDETQGLTSNLRPTNFKKGGRGLDSTPNRSERLASEQAVRESPPTGSGNTFFSSLMGNYGHDPSRMPAPRSTAGDSASAYGSTSRAPRPQQYPPSRAKAGSPDAVHYRTLNDVEDYNLRLKIYEMQQVISGESVQRCADALAKSRNNKDDAMNWLIESENVPKRENSDADPLSNMSSVMKRGVAMTKPSVAAQPKPEPKVQSKTIAERFLPTQRKAPRPTGLPESDEDEEEDLQPKRRLLKGRKQGRSPTPPSSPPPAQKVLQSTAKKAIVISDDEDEEARSETPDSEDEQPRAPVETVFDTKLLKFFNECSVSELADLSASPETAATFVLDHRPFADLDAIRVVSNAGPKSRQAPLGDRLVEKCAQMLGGYDAVDELVNECEKLAKPIQKALKGWGINREDGGELELMNLDDAHDSGIGTPASSCASEEVATKQGRGKFLTQPSNMSEDMKLKDYQLVGLNWLNLLWSKKISCILADDMGLGKTCQVIAFLAHLQQQQVDGVHLIIVPGSTIANWLREFQRFAPELNVFPYYGTDKERPELRLRYEEDFANIDVVVTTYDVAVKDHDNHFLRKQVQPAVCVFDEAHLLRNPKTDRYQKLVRIPADMRLLLTGTPLQNNLRELVAILAFIMPDLFEEKREKLDFIFDQKATTKDANHAALLSAERIARARTMMTPFILRRKKAQVLDLPTKHRRVEMCDMLPTQAAYYYSLVDEARASMHGTAAEKKRKSSNIMMALRQAAIHPLLSRRHYSDRKIDKIVTVLLKHDEYAGNTHEKVRAYLTGESKTGQRMQGGDFALHRFCEERPYLHQFCLKKTEWMDSGKVQKLKELVTAYAANGDRVLVFSQFTTLMDILEAVLETLNLDFKRLDGSTKMEDRQDLIDKFTDDTSVPVFMLSTKAGGAGINLAAANKVIVFDSGFNPQDDIQAENRAHRVGQTREVEVVRLVTNGTIEQQIQALGESKLALDERVAGDAGGEEVERTGRAMVEKAFLESLKGEGEEGKRAKKGGADGDLRDAFKMGMEKSGVKVASKQAQF
ncbi:DNA-dependent ATPase fun30 [Teratosphaeriaceae sp. CCFEE 6253]|nr:DNA-dependent ATPase fun30 [Teratosphaeriaceae sp. CCFEE 6253]